MISNTWKRIHVKTANWVHNRKRVIIIPSSFESSHTIIIIQLISHRNLNRARIISIISRARRCQRRSRRGRAGEKSTLDFGPPGHGLKQNRISARQGGNECPGVIHESVEYRQSRSRKLRGEYYVRYLRGVATACTLLKLKSILAGGERDRERERNGERTSEMWITARKRVWRGRGGGGRGEEEIEITSGFYSSRWRL